MKFWRFESAKAKMGTKLRIAAYLLIILIAGFSAQRSQTAIQLARTVDHRGDIRACNQENLIRLESNKRDALLEQTAKLTRDALLVLREAYRPGDASTQDTNRKLRLIAAKAAKIQTNFAPAKIVDCNKVFPKS